MTDHLDGDPRHVDESEVETDLAEWQRKALNKRHDEEWPPTDDNGNRYPIFFSRDDLDDEGYLNHPGTGNQYNPFAGNLEPVENKCNYPLKGSKSGSRYPEPRYCSRWSMATSPLCYQHDERALDTATTVEESLQTGIFTRSVQHLYDKLPVYKQLLVQGLYEVLLGDSIHEFGIEYAITQFDFTDAEYKPDSIEMDVVTRKVAEPTQNQHRAAALWIAATNFVQMLDATAEVAEAGMETTSPEHAQLTAPDEDGGGQQWMTIETTNEHHLNLPISRLVRDYKDHLQVGGVEITPDEDQSDTGMGLADFKDDLETDDPEVQPETTPK